MSFPNQKSLEEKFHEENGMTLEEAWGKVREWNLAGKKEEAKKGCEIILEFFPNHEAKDLLAHLSGAPAKKMSMAEKWGSKFADSAEKVIMRAKKARESKKEKIPESKVENPSSVEPEPKAPSTESHEETHDHSSQQSFLKESSPEKEESSESKPVVLEDERLFATISYAWIFCVIPLLMKKDSEFVMFHAKQGLVLAILITVFDLFVGGILNLALPAIGFFLKVIYLGMLGYAAYGAYLGKYWKIPFVYNLSQKIKI
ncbi:DUF4870 domain-containing protein [Candidatus Peregrinibacteria bacterium]|nr:DUF4870 domain-containing protein [Candidatus Peregrinibacteria bacterium]